MFKFSVHTEARLILLGMLFTFIMSGTAVAQSASSGAATLVETAAAPANANPPAAQRRYRPTPVPERASRYYRLMWGVDALTVKSVESGELIRFAYRVLDASKSEMLNDRKSEPYLIAPRAGVRLEIPQLEKVGKLRQSSSPEAGKTYWMAFSNKGRLVRPGDHVSIVIGSFRADGLVVE